MALFWPLVSLDSRFLVFLLTSYLCLVVGISYMFRAF